LNFGLGYGDFVPRVDSSKADQTGEEVEEFFGFGRNLETEKLEKRKYFVIETGQIVENEKKTF
jgi:hypothetical protein